LSSARESYGISSQDPEKMMVEGPTSEASTQVFKKVPVPDDKFKPAVVDEEYALQVVFKRTALEQLASLDKEILTR
jgi:hypothetical protein